MIGGFQVGPFQPAYQQGTSGVVVGGGDASGWRKKRRSVVVNGKPYIGTEEEIESLLVSLLDDETIEPVKVRAKTKPIEIVIEDSREVPENFNVPLYKSLIKESFQSNDPWLTFALKEIRRRYEEEEDDIEAILWGLH